MQVIANTISDGQTASGLVCLPEALEPSILSQIIGTDTDTGLAGQITTSCDWPVVFYALQGLKAVIIQAGHLLQNDQIDLVMQVANEIKNDHFSKAQVAAAETLALCLEL